MGARTLIWLVMSAAIAIATGCSGTQEVTPMDEADQAFIDLRDQIRLLITDANRQSKVVELVSALESDLNNLGGRVSERQRQIQELNANYDATRAEFEALLAETNLEIRANRESVTARYESLVEYTTPEEREALEKYRSKAISQAIKAMRSI